MITAGLRNAELVYVDDSTSHLMQIHFVKSESTFTYFDGTRGYLEQHGKPLAFYSDKGSIFRINKNAAGGDGRSDTVRARDEREEHHWHLR